MAEKAIKHARNQHLTTYRDISTSNNGTTSSYGLHRYLSQKQIMVFAFCRYQNGGDPSSHLRHHGMFPSLLTRQMTWNAYNSQDKPLLNQGGIRLVAVKCKHQKINEPNWMAILVEKQIEWSIADSKQLSYFTKLRCIHYVNISKWAKQDDHDDGMHTTLTRSKLSWSLYNCSSNHSEISNHSFPSEELQHVKDTLTHTELVPKILGLGSMEIACYSKIYQSSKG